MNPLEIPEIVIKRLPLYLRMLELMADEGQVVTSSQELGSRLGISSTQIRKDLSYFGEFGKQGTGYDIHFLRGQLRGILQVDRPWKVALIGVGDVGHALLRLIELEDRGFSIAAIFDKDPQKIDRRIDKLTVLDVATLHEVILRRGIRVAIIAVPACEAQGIADALFDAGVGAILSYAPILLKLPPHVRVSYLDPVVGLQSMTYYLSPSRP